MTSRRCALLRVASWVAIAATIRAPWRELGGVVDERSRWLADLALGVAPVISFALARTLDVALDRRAVRGVLARALAYPPAVIAAAALPGLAWGGHDPEVGIVLLALVGWLAGVDFGLHGWRVVKREPPAEERFDR